MGRQKVTATLAMPGIEIRGQEMITRKRIYNASHGTPGAKVLEVYAERYRRVDGLIAGDARQ